MYAPTLSPIDVPATLPVQVQSFSNPLKSYRVTDTCPCKGFQVRKSCRHMAVANEVRATPRCYYCGTNPSPDGIAACEYCAAMLADMVSQSRDETDAFLARLFPAPVVAELASCEWPSTAHCVTCNRVYTVTESTLLYCSHRCAGSYAIEAA